jgi:hypothetical protein
MVSTLMAIAALSMSTILAGAHTGHNEPAPIAECAVASPQADSGTPAAADLASPAPLDLMVDTAPALGTPVDVPCLTVTLEADAALSGPIQLTASLVDDNGRPVTGATVVILTRHLEMDHGTSVNETVEADPGMYTVERVPMGMGGMWQADVLITRPGFETVTATFLIDLEGPA